MYSLSSIAAKNFHLKNDEYAENLVLFIPERLI